MSGLKWNEVLGWDQEQMEDFRVLAFFYIREGKYQMAKTFLEALVILNPESVYDLQTLGALFLQLNEPVSALNYLEKAQQLDPKNSIIQINRIKAMLSMGYREEGLSLLEEFIPNCPDKFLVSDAEALKMAYQV